MGPESPTAMKIVTVNTVLRNVTVYEELTHF